MACPVIESGHLIGKKWSIQIIEEIAFERFDSFNGFLRKSKSITPRTLSSQLKELEAAGLVKKKYYNNSNNTAVTYNLTPKGKEMHSIIGNIKKWSAKWNKMPESCLSIPCTECPQFATR